MNTGLGLFCKNVDFKNGFWLETSVDDFYEFAVMTCNYLDGLNVTLERTDELMAILMQLYVLGLGLNSADPEEKDVNYDLLGPDISFEVPDTYWEIYDPLLGDDNIEGEVVAGNLYDDLYDIFINLKEGVAEYEAGNKGSAEFLWRLGVDGHWGKHVTDALRALHAIREMGYTAEKKA